MWWPDTICRTRKSSRAPGRFRRSSSWRTDTGSGEPARAHRAPRAALGRLLAGRELAQHVLQNPAVNEVVLLLRRVDAHDRGELLLPAVLARRGDLHVLRALRAQADDVERLVALEAQALGGFARLELQRHDAHADQVRAVNALVALGDHGTDAEQRGAFRGPVARAARAVLLARKD